MDLIAAIEESWGWAGLHPVQVVADNSFGNLIVKDIAGRYWRLCPDVPSCEIIAQDRKDLDAISHDQNFVHDWYMRELVALAHSVLGQLQPGYRYGLKTPTALGGGYTDNNFASNPLQELVSFSGSVARKISTLPYGTQARPPGRHRTSPIHIICATCLLVPVLGIFVPFLNFGQLGLMGAALVGIVASIAGLAGSKSGRGAPFVLWLLIFTPLFLLCLAPVSH